MNNKFENFKKSGKSRFETGKNGKEGEIIRFNSIFIFYSMNTNPIKQKFN